MVEAKAALETRSRLFDTVLSSIADFAYVFDRDGRFRYVNKALLDLWGLDLPQAVGRDFHELGYPPELATRLQRQIQEVVDTGARVTDETSYTSPTGKEGFYEYIFVPILAGDGRTVEAVAGSTRDVSARKQTERDLAAARQHAEHLGHLKDEFLATLSHELRTPLSAILGWTHVLMQRSSNDETTQKALDAITRNARAQAQLIDDMLDLGRIEAGKMRLDVTRFDLRDAVGAAIESVVHAAAARQVGAADRFPGSAGDGVGRRGPHPAGDVEPRQQRGQVHRRRRDGRRLDRARWRVRAHGGRRHRHRHRARVPAVCLRPLSPGGVGGERRRRARHRARAGQAAHHAARRQRHGDERRARPGCDVHGRPAGIAGRARVRRPPDGGLAPSGSRRRPRRSPASRSSWSTTTRIPACSRRASSATWAPRSCPPAMSSRPCWRSSGIDPTLRCATSTCRARTATISSRGCAAWPRARDLPVVAFSALARPEDRERAMAAGFARYLTKPIVPAELAYVVASVARG